jgi:hypothetical protein
MTFDQPQGAGSPSATPLPPEHQASPSPDPTSKKPRNILGLIAFIVAVVGFIFACIPGALIVGWVLLPIAFILGIVSLFMKGRGKGLGITAIILSVVGTVVAVAVFFAVVADAVDDSLGGTDVSVSDPVDEAAPATESTAEGEAPADATAGTRDNPVAIGSTITGEDWTAVVNSYTIDGNATVAAEQFNEAAPAGSHYEIVNYTVTYTGDESGYAGEVIVDVVTSSGNVVNGFDNFVVLSDSIGADELFNGATTTGSQAFVVPDGDAALVRVQPGIIADEIFVKP